MVDGEQNRLWDVPFWLGHGFCVLMQGERGLMAGTSLLPGLWSMALAGDKHHVFESFFSFVILYIRCMIMAVSVRRGNQ